MPVTAHCCYLNTGSLGPVSSIFADSLARLTATDVARGRARSERYASLESARERLRAEIAALLHARPEEIALTQGTGHGIETLVERIPWRAGDEILTTSLEHGACEAPLRRAAARHGIGLAVAEPGPDRGEELRWLMDRLTPRTRLIALSAVTFESGWCLPLEQIAARAAQANVPTLIDAAQCAGAARLDLPALGVDYCALPMQKWLCGPEGLGALYVRQGALGPLEEPSRDRVIHGHGILAAAAAQMSWQREAIGWDWILSRTTALAEHARQALARLPRARLLTPPSHAGLTTIAFEGTDTQRVDDALVTRGFLVRHLPELKALRVSTAYFNTAAEIDALAAALTEIVESRCADTAT